MSFFSKKIASGADARGLGALTAQLESALQSVYTSSNRKALTTYSVGTESLTDVQSQEFSSAVESLDGALERITRSLSLEGISKDNINSAVAAGMMAGNVEAFLRSPIHKPVAMGAGQVVVDMQGFQEGMFKRVNAFEAYDEKENRNAAVYSMAYNMRAGRQNEFGEALFPTVVVTPDNVGFGVSIRLIQLFNDFKRDISGDLDNYEKKNILRALVDHTILKNDMTRIIPVHRAESTGNFVAAGDVAPAAINLDGESITTAPLAVKKKFSLLAIGQTDALLANGAMDASDAIDPAIKLKNVYVKVGTNVLKFNTLNLPLANFVAAPQGNYRLMNLSFTSDSVLMNKDSKLVDGTAMVAPLDAIVTSDFIIRVSLNVTGNVNIETGETAVFGNLLQVSSIQNADGDFQDFTVAGAAKDVADAINGGTIIGYDLQAFRTNSNRRQRGQLLDVTYFTQLYAVPLLAPISALRTTTSDGQSDTSDLSALITATQIRTSNAAVTALMETNTLLSQYIDARDTAGVGPDVLGVGRFLVRPTYIGETLNMATDVDSVKSHERADDIQAVLVNKMRTMVYKMYTDSNYKAAADAMAGGEAPVPTVIIATDQQLSRWMMTSGDFRTLGPDFNVKIVSTQDERMKGRIALTFGNFDGSGANKPDPLHFGNMAWKPEVTVVLPISRGGSISKELTVQPSFLHVVNCPILGMIEVTGIPEVVASKVPLNMEII